MKPAINTILTTLSAVAVLLSSCTKYENEKRDPKHIGSEVTATFEQPVSDDATKALDNQFHFSFENNEQINIYPQALGLRTLFPVSAFQSPHNTYCARYQTCKRINIFYQTQGSAP